MVMVSTKSIEFGLMSPKFILDISAVKIDHPEIYDPDGFPIDSGLTDLRLGVVDPGFKCKTCGGSVGQCLGHFGHLELTKPVINPLFGKRIYMLVKSTCRKCSRPLADKEELEKMKNPLAEIHKKPRKTCPWCGEKQKDITFSKPTTFREGKDEINAEAVRQRLERIPDDDVKLLKVRGGRPEWFILTILPIPPVTVRPSITLETGERSEDDLTHKLVDIVRINERLKKNLELGAPDFIIADIWELLQYHISTYMDNEITTIPPARHRSGRALRTLIQRLSKKEGRFRGNLSGKRVNFSARTVISPDSRISSNEVGVPEEISKELTIPTKINKNNITALKKIILTGPNTHPGANYVIRPDGIRKKITDENKKDISEEIDNGYIVERHLHNGDMVIFNRQPSLHRMSMMAHKVRVMPFRTFRMNLTVTTPYNADFDGDEMNLHVPQTEEAQVEAEMLMSIEKNIRSPRYGLPIITCKQDHITGCFFLTRNETQLTKKQAVELMISAGMDEYMDRLPDKISGKKLFSYLMPNSLNMEYKAATCRACKKCLKHECQNDVYVVIKNGELKSGVIDDTSLGEKKGKLINAIEHLDSTLAREFIDKVSKLGIEMITRTGFSISVSDEDISNKARNRIKAAIEECEQNALKEIKSFSTGKIAKTHGLTAREMLETSIRKITGEASKRCTEIVKEDLPFNSAVTMARTGARGSYVNLTQMCALVGQESLEGERIHRGFVDRTLSHFKKLDISLKSRGFVNNCYKDGLDPFDFFFDAINSRENLMDKSLHTRHSGYMERRLINALQDLHVKPDNTVRDSRGHIVQFLAGEDGIDPAKADNGKINIELLNSMN
ncbi:MAG: DNA-directed RNA polymerase subunit A' [Candidatus Aenigmatarchaeota archaeon]